MIFRAGQAIARLSQPRAVGPLYHRVCITPTRIQRVLRTYITTPGCYALPTTQKDCLSGSANWRAYATTTKPVSRPKAHTGRPTSRPRKAATTKNAEASTESSSRKPAAKASKPKPRGRPKTKAKAKPKPKKKKVLTEAQKATVAAKKARSDLKELKQTALVVPKKLPDTAWMVFISERAKAGKGVADTGAAAEYKSLPAEEIERYNHSANSNKHENAVVYRRWIESHSPEQIYRANLARLKLKRLSGKPQSYPRLRDDRQVKRPVTAYMLFSKDRHLSGDFKGIKVSESAVLIGREWKGLSESERKRYQDATAVDSARYTKEFKDLYHHEPQAAAAAA